MESDTTSGVSRQTPAPLVLFGVAPLRTELFSKLIPALVLKAFSTKFGCLNAPVLQKMNKCCKNITIGIFL